MKKLAKALSVTSAIVAATGMGSTASAQTVDGTKVDVRTYAQPANGFLDGSINVTLKNGYECIVELDNAFTAAATVTCLGTAQYPYELKMKTEEGRVSSASKNSYRSAYAGIMTGAELKGLKYVYDKAINGMCGMGRSASLGDRFSTNGDYGDYMGALYTSRYCTPVSKFSS